MKLTSPAFAEGEMIPARFTCDGVNVSPALQWSGAPAETREFALLCEDPDAPGGLWVHWVLYHLAGAVNRLPEELPGSATLPGGARQGLTDFKRTGYGGPCPPEGGPHRYFFKLYALDTELPLEPRATRQELLSALAGHVLAEAALMGRYQRRR